MTAKKLFLSVVLLATFLAGQALPQRNPATAQPQFARESAFERVQRTGIIRCGYIVWPPYLIKNPNTGALTGAAAELMQAIATELDMTVEWSEEVGWGNFQEGLNAGRYDAMCTPVWQSGQRAKVALLTRPVFYSKMVAIARAGDARFDAGTAALDRGDVRIAVIDGDITQSIRKTYFPQAQELAVSPIADPSHMILSVVTRKADVAIADAENMRRYNAGAGAHDQLKLAIGGQPVRLFGNTIGLRLGEQALKAQFDAVIDALYTSGKLPTLVEQYREHFTAAAQGYVER